MDEYLLAAMREVDAMLPDSPRIYPAVTTAFGLGMMCDLWANHPDLEQSQLEAIEDRMRAEMWRRGRPL